MQSLLNGVPLILFPRPVFERRNNAAKMQAAGAGMFGELPDFREDRLRGVLGNRANYAPKAAMLQARIKGYGGAAAAVEAIEGFRKRVARVDRARAQA